MKDYYTILGVTRTATEDEIKKAYRKLAHQYHPDKAGGDETKFKEINEAYQVLSDKNKRAQYDRFGNAGPSMGGFPGARAEDFPKVLASASILKTWATWAILATYSTALWRASVCVSVGRPMKKVPTSKFRKISLSKKHSVV